MMLEINLQEYTASEQRLSADQLEVLLQESKNLHLSVEPVKGRNGRYKLTPASMVGALEIGDVSVLIEPKIGIPKLLSLVCYAMGFYKTKEQHIFNFKRAKTLPDILALALTAAARRALGRGLLRGYLTKEDALYTVRGRIRFSEQIRRRYGIPLPVELSFDEFTEDILANRLVKAAAARLGFMTLRSPEARRGLGWVTAILENVSLVEYRRRVPNVRFDRLNEHYRHVVGLARLILLHSQFESQRGDVRASGFLIDMNVLFQEFVMQALRESLDLSANTLRAGRQFFLDTESKAKMYPDISVWEDSVTCTFVGDAKYKIISGDSLPNADLYQLLAYTTALDLPGGLLIYAKGEAETAQYIVRHAGKRLEVFALDLSGSLDQILAHIDALACKIETLRSEALNLRASKNTIASQSPAAHPTPLATKQRILA